MGEVWKFPVKGSCHNDHHNILNDDCLSDKQAIFVSCREKAENRAFSPLWTTKEKQPAVLKRLFDIDIIVSCIIEMEKTFAVSNWKMGKI